MGSRFKKRGVGSIKADEKGGAEAGAASEVDCSTLLAFAMALGVNQLTPTMVTRQQRQATLQKACRHVSVAEPLAW